MSDIYDLADTWNAAETVFTSIKMDVTQTAYAAGSKFLDFLAGSVSQFSVRVDGFIEAGSGDYRWELRGRGSDVVNFGVPYFRSAKTDTPTAFDLMPNGTGGAGGVKAWMHICNNDISAPNSNNWEALFLAAYSTATMIGSDAGGTGTVRPLYIGGSSIYFQNKTQGLATPYGAITSTAWLFGNSDNPWTAMFSSEVRYNKDYRIGFTDETTTYANINTVLTRSAAGVLRLANNDASAGATLELLEQAAPAVAAANGVRIFAQDNGAGKTQLMAIFHTGVAQQIAIEP